MARLSIDRALSAPKGVSLADDLIGLFAGSEIPSEIDDGVPQGSIYFRDNGELWQKVGPNISDWDVFRTGFKEGNVPVLSIDDEEVFIPIVNNQFELELTDGSVSNII